MLSNGHLNLFTQFFKKKFQYEKTATNFKRKPLVLKVKGSMVTARFQDGRETTRDASKFKLAKMATEEAQQRESWSEGESELTGKDQGCHGAESTATATGQGTREVESNNTSVQQGINQQGNSEEPRRSTRHRHWQDKNKEGGDVAS